jgi:hypothetical protein
MSAVRLVFNESGMKRFFGDPAGPVAAHINKKAAQILTLGEQIAREKFQERSGLLFSSFRSVPFVDAEGYHVAVGNDAQHRGFSYARALETGFDEFGRPISIGTTKTGASTGKTVGYMIPAVERAGFVRRA